MNKSRHKFISAIYMIATAVFAAILILSYSEAVNAMPNMKAVLSIKGSTITYYDNVDDHWLAEGGQRSRKKITLSKKAGFYWYKPRNIWKFKKISKKTFLKRIKYRYRVERNEYAGKRRPGEFQLCKFRIRKGKVDRIYGLYSP